MAPAGAGVGRNPFLTLNERTFIVKSMPRTPEANEALRQKSGERILKAAVRLFSRRGFGTFRAARPVGFGWFWLPSRFSCRTWLSASPIGACR